MAFDFISLNDCDVVYYWETKTRQNENENSFTVTKPQWKFATYLYTEGEGDKYCFLVVTLDTKKVKEFFNPVKLWIEGYLEAKPLELSWKDEE